MRDALDRLDRLAIRYFVTGSEAAACYGSLRQTFDMDVVIDLDPPEFPRIASAFGADQWAPILDVTGLLRQVRDAP